MGTAAEDACQKRIDRVRACSASLTNCRRQRRRGTVPASRMRTQVVWRLGSFSRPMSGNTSTTIMKKMTATGRRLWLLAYPPPTDPTICPRSNSICTPTTHTQTQRGRKDTLSQRNLSSSQGRARGGGRMNHISLFSYSLFQASFLEHAPRRGWRAPQ